MWKANFLIIVYATLGSFCLKIIGSGTKLNSNENKESNGTNPEAWLEDTEGYQSDQPASTVAWHELVESKLRHLNPTVYCGGDAMTLRVQGSTMPNFMIDGGDGPVPLTQIPANCGLSMTQGPTDAVFTVHYQGCYVTQQGEGHVLTVHLWGMPMKMSCPLAMYPNVSCLPSHMVTKLNCNSANALKLKVNGKWEPFISASSTCGITAESEPDGVVVTAPYQSSCWQIKGDERFLSILYGNEELILSCPDSLDAQPYGRIGIMSYQSYEPNITTPTDTIRTTNILTVTTGPGSNPKQPMSYPFGYMYYGYAGEIPAGMSTATSVTISPTTYAPATISTSTTVDMMHYPFGPMLYHHKPKPYGYPWVFPAKAPTTAPTTTTSQTTATTSTTVASNPQQPPYPFNQKHYPFGLMPYHPKPIPYGYPWAFPAKAPTTAPTTTTSQTTATTSTTVASNPQQPPYPFNQKHYPFGLMPYHLKPIPYGYHWAFPAKAPTTAPTTTTSQTTATTSTTVASNPQQPPYPFNQKHYPFGLMPYHLKPIPYGYHWAFPAKAPTTAPTTTTSQTTATTSTTVASNPQQPPYPFNQKHYPFGLMPYHPKPIPYGYPWAFPAKAPTTAP
ncbi:hypothetical protein QTP86_018408, partial [Hemibagrus guttatus]